MKKQKYPVWIHHSSTPDDIKYIREISDMPEGATGFIYMIILGSKSYLGKKSLYSNRKRKFGKREIANMPNKRLKKYEIITKESNWKYYASSNDEVNEVVNSGAEYARVIIDYSFGKQHLTYLETKYLFKYEVLENEEFYNSNISATFYKKNMRKYFPSN